METYSLITRPDAKPDETGKNSRDEATLLDAAFHIAGKTRLQLDMRDWSDDAGEYFDHAVSRQRSDLRRHVQRVYFHIDRGDADAVYGALVDLFIVLNASGRPLRQRMLNAARTILGEKRHGFLAQHLEASITATDAIPPSGASMFSNGLIGSNRLVIKLGSPTVPQQDPLDEARDRIEYGQVDEARQVLEAAILRDALRPDLHYDLLEIYKKTEAKDAFLVMHRKMDPQTNPAADAWNELADFFGNGV